MQKAKDVAGKFATGLAAAAVVASVRLLFDLLVVRLVSTNVCATDTDKLVSNVRSPRPPLPTISCRA